MTVCVRRGVHVDGGCMPMDAGGCCADVGACRASSCSC